MMAARDHLGAPPRRLELAIAVSAAVLLVLFRSFVPVWYEGYDFDSDQAVVGLMAKHLAELRAFPLFFYGQNYMLGVQAWMAAPLFAIAHPSVLLLRLPLVPINCLVAAALVVGIVRTAKLSPALAFVAALPFVMPPPVVASRLLQTLGASVEPCLYVIALWRLRDRPFLFGTLLGVGFLHREFTIFAVPALLAVKAIDRSLFTRATLAWMTRTATAFAAVWIVVDVVKRHLNGSGPTTGPIQAGPLVQQIQTLLRRTCITPSGLIDRFDSFFVDCLPDLLGSRTQRLNQLSLNSMTFAGSHLLMWTLGATAVIMLVSPGKPPGDDRPRADLRFVWYLGIVGVEAILAYPFSCEVLPGYPGLLRYVLLALFIPTAAFVWFFSRRQPLVVKAIVVASFVFWAGMNFADNARVLHEYRTNPPPNKFRGLADYLVVNGIKYARAPYWDSYIVDFMSRERVIVASTGKVRVQEYQRLVDEHKAEAADIRRVPCSGGVLFDAWCISTPSR